MSATDLLCMNINIKELIFILLLS